MNENRVFPPQKKKHIGSKIAPPQDPRLQQWLDDNPTFGQLISNLPRASRHPGGNENTRKIWREKKFGGNVIDDDLLLGIGNSIYERNS